MLAHSFSCKIAVDKLFAAPKHNTYKLTLGPCFPPAVERGARPPPPRRWRQKGPASGKPARLLCEHEEDRNRRRPHPRGPNVEKPRTEADCFAQQCLRSGTPNPSQFSHQEVKEFLQSVNTESVFCSAEHRFHQAVSKMID